ncbi:SDR family oxidoreductase [Mucilaginibacter mali]|uniref:SDR family oxidoreductase n=1 Tax=Mucilaginibacter mali TaxID=2740462 RepID=A0A7D4UJN3_9SPHI|nr:SDR family oxidoreductase [Mucilaginibacter mali]QKJ29402.1 SDR family oxidoreductase [Mucilaginibacter mali]
MFSVKDKVIVVTGGNGLLGKKIVNSLRAEEGIVVSVDIKFDHQHSDNLMMDITNETSVNKGVSEILSKYGKINAWINNAYPRTADWGNALEDVEFDSWRKNVDMHLNGYFLCCKIVLNTMKDQGYGSLVNMSSIYGLVGPDFTVYEGTQMTNAVAYSAIKGGINNLTRYLASYYGPYQVRVNCVSPGGIFDNQSDVFLKNYNKKVPMRRMGTPEDIVAAVHYLISDEASYVTGHNLIVDGGWTAI